MENSIFLVQVTRFLLIVALFSTGAGLPSQFDSALFGRDELLQLDVLRAKTKELRVVSVNDAQTVDWVQDRATDVELLRWIRHLRHSDTEQQLTAIKKHVAWRTSPLGADTVSQPQHTRKLKEMYDKLAQEVFWLGESKTGCPTLVIRTQMHDGAMYNEDVSIFTSFMVYTLEEGRRRYGAGTERKVCLLMDRSRVVMPGGVVKKEVLDMGVVPKLVELFTLLYSTLYHNYPDLLAGAQVLPSSWFFSLCYRVTSQVMDRDTRSKFEMISVGDVKKVMRAQFPLSALPEHLGGSSRRYGDDIKFSVNGGPDPYSWQGELAALQLDQEASPSGGDNRTALRDLGHNHNQYHNHNHNHCQGGLSSSECSSRQGSDLADHAPLSWSLEEQYVLGVQGAAWAGRLGDSHDRGARSSQKDQSDGRRQALFFGLTSESLLESWI